MILKTVFLSIFLVCFVWSFQVPPEWLAHIQKVCSKQEDSSTCPSESPVTDINGQVGHSRMYVFVHNSSQTSEL